MRDKERRGGERERVAYLGLAAEDALARASVFRPSGQCSVVFTNVIFVRHIWRAVGCLSGFQLDMIWEVAVDCGRRGTAAECLICVCLSL